uniref:Uncharacterized protein n=1 Tax=Sphaerodactylus townsendi TaxID=933632 RepID=A0ACB8E8F6_9SAUR
MEMKILEAKADAAGVAKQVDFLKRKEEIIEEQAHLKAQEAAHQAQLKAQEEARQAKVEAALSTLKQRAKAEKLITRAQVLEQGLKESLFTFRSEEIEEEDPMMKVSSYLIQQSSNFGEVTADSEEFRVTEHLAAAESAELMSQMSRVQQSMVQFQPQHSMVAPVVLPKKETKEAENILEKPSQPKEDRTATATCTAMCDGTKKDALLAIRFVSQNIYSKASPHQAQRTSYQIIVSWHCNVGKHSKETWKKKPQLKEDVIAFINTMIEKGHAEKLLTLKTIKNAGIYHFFGVYHPEAT